MSRHPNDAPEHPQGDGWFDDPGRVEWIYRGLVAACVALVIADLFYHRHAYFDLEHVPGFYGFFGFVAFVGIVLGGTWLRKVIMRDEHYYDP